MMKESFSFIKRFIHQDFKNHTSIPPHALCAEMQPDRIGVLVPLNGLAAVKQSTRVADLNS